MSRNTHSFVRREDLLSLIQRIQNTDDVGLRDILINQFNIKCYGDDNDNVKKCN